LTKNIYLLSQTKLEQTINTPTFKIEFLSPKIDFSGINTLVFTSKNGVKAIDQISKNWRNFPSVAVGVKTAETILKFGGKLLATSLGNGKDLEEMIKERYNNRTFLYLRPEKVAREIAKNLKQKKIRVEEIVVYKTKCFNSGKINKRSILIATSPSSVACLLKNFIVPKDSIFVSIGITTAKSIPEYFEKHLSEEQTLESCYEKAKELALN
jgi:uroporphyrinogen-III synthase